MGKPFREIESAIRAKGFWLLPHTQGAGVDYPAQVRADALALGAASV